MGDVRVGISGWRYAPWRGTFDPDDLPQRAELEYASRRLRTIEINGTFYSLQRATSFRSWAESVPEDFVFSVKGPRLVTHNRKLADVEQPLANFFASGVLALGEHLGPFLWQLPPYLHFHADRVEAFCRLLPHSTDELARLARRHGDWMSGRVVLTAGEDRPVRHAMEVRHASFVTDEFTDLLRRYDVAVVIADSPTDWPRFDEPTTDLAYLRLHGAGQIYAGGYDEPSLREWAERIRAWRRGRDVVVYLDNDAKARAPGDAQRLAALLGVGVTEPPPDHERTGRPRRERADA